MQLARHHGVFMHVRVPSSVTTLSIGCLLPVMTRAAGSLWYVSLRPANEHLSYQTWLSVNRQPTHSSYAEPTTKAANHTLDSNKLGILSEDKIVVVRIDVTHPSPGSASNAPSVASMVASIDANIAQWPADVRTQTARQEMVGDLEGMEVPSSRVERRLRYKTSFQTLTTPRAILSYVRVRSSNPPRSYHSHFAGRGDDCRSSTPRILALQRGAWRLRRREAATCEKGTDII